jgi:hypothetical protein
MRFTLVITACAALALTACQPPAPQNGAANTSATEANAVGNETGAGNDVGAQIAALEPGLRDGTLFRAILDAKSPCNGVEGSARIADINGHPRWRADCKNNGPSYAIEVPPDGVLIVIGPLAHGQPAQ